MKRIAFIIVFLLCGFVLPDLSAQPYEGRKGDVNNDGEINVLDMLATANQILGMITLDREEIWRADLNGPVGSCEGDGTVNILDMVKMANIILEIDDCSGRAVTDIDGNVYNTVTIGEQVWMAENLRVTNFRNGDPIPHVSVDSQWSGLSTGAYCNHDNDVNSVAEYGRLYNWYAVEDNRNIAPEGWRVPTDDDWKQLELSLGMSPSEIDVADFRGTDEGGKLKATGTIEGGDGLWNAPNTGATNSSGFSALPIGPRSYDGHFVRVGFHADFWSATEYESNSSWGRNLNYTNSAVYRYYFNKNYGFSVRCVREN